MPLPTIRESCAEWDRLIPAALASGIRATPLNGRTWRTSRENAARRVAELRSRVAPFVAPMVDVVDLALSSQTFGVEFEVLMPRGMTRTQLILELVNAGVQTEDQVYNHRPAGVWKLVTDGSLGDYTRGVELVSPILRGIEGLELVRKAANVLRATGCKATKKCGFHVHVGARDRSVSFFKYILKMYRAFEPAIDSLMAPSRRASQNQYCRMLMFSEAAVDRADSIEALRFADYNLRDRYRKVNIDAYWRHGTVEFRQHQGTVEANKAIAWIKFCLRMTYAATQVDEGFFLADGERTLDALLFWLEVPAAERTFLAERAATLARNEAAAHARRYGPAPIVNGPVPPPATYAQPMGSSPSIGAPSASWDYESARAA